MVESLNKTPNNHISHSIPVGRGVGSSANFSSEYAPITATDSKTAMEFYQQKIAKMKDKLPENPSARLAGQYCPILDDKHEGTEKSFLSKAGLNFNLSSFMSYYPMLRFFGYTSELIFSKLIEAGSGGEKAKHSDGKRKISLIERTEWGRELKRQYRAGELTKNIARGEAAVFTGLAATFFFKEKKDIHADFDLAVAAECGLKEDDVSLSDLYKSKNPIIHSAMNRFNWQHLLRHTAGLAFARSIPTGIFANAILITAERTIFYRPIAYDILKKAVVDVQANRLGEEVRDELVDDLIRTLQAARMDHRRPVISKKEIDGLRPVLTEIAQDVIDRKIGIEGMIYVMGGGVLVPENPELSYNNYKHVQDVRVTGIAEEGRWMREQTGTPPDKTWESKIRATRENGYIARSATEEELIRHRDLLHARGPVLAGIEKEGRRSGARMNTGNVL